jgi:hypothetical protein
MPSYLDFDSTKKFRDFILGKTLNQPNIPDTYQNVVIQSNIDPGTVDDNRKDTLTRIQNNNTFRPSEYIIREDLDVLPIIRNLGLYPYFPTNSPNYNLVGIMGSSSYDTESELFKFAANTIKNDRQGPVLSRIQRNLETATTGRIRLLDALDGNTATLSNILTGKEPLVESNNRITVAKTLPGKAIDFLQTLSGTQLPFSEIPGDYLTNPLNPTPNFRPEAKTAVGGLIQDITGAIGSLIGIQRRPKPSRKPSDLFIEYMGEGQKQRLFDGLTFNTYAPNYTTTARSQNSSKIFSFIDKVAQGVKNILGTEAPAGKAYIGDDRGNDVKRAMSDFNDRPVKSPYYLSVMFDEVAANLFNNPTKTRTISQGGNIGGNLTWYSSNSQNKLGKDNSEFDSERSKFEESLSTKYGFREDSILGLTQEILNSMPKDGSRFDHIGNVIDQTSRAFKDGNIQISRGSAVKYLDGKGEDAGVEYCRVWTKDRSYMNYSDVMPLHGEPLDRKFYKRSSRPYRRTNIRKFDSSVMSDTWNLNMGPMSNGNKDFAGSTNIVDGYPFGRDKDGKGFYAKKYMFSIENLAWKTSTLQGFTVLDLPYCERGPNGGRVMWFPPYDLKVSEQNNARWESNTFLGRPEPIYTYQNTERSGQVSFKVIVDHPSILNLLTREHFKGMSDEAADDYINSFFAGCKDIDFYSLIRTYTTLDGSDVDLIKQYLDEGGPVTEIPKFKLAIPETEKTAPGGEDPAKPPQSKPIKLDINLKFPNDFPKKTGGDEYISGQSYKSFYDSLISAKDTSKTNLGNDIRFIYNRNTSKDKKDLELLGYKNLASSGETESAVTRQGEILMESYSKLTTGYTDFNTKLDILKSDISGKTVEDVKIYILSSTSAVADNNYNFKLSLRRTHAILQEIISKISNDPTVGKATLDKKWKLDASKIQSAKGQEKASKDIEFNYRDLGYERDGKLTISTTSAGEFIANEAHQDCHTADFNYVDLRINSPIAFGCRQTYVKMEYEQLPKPEEPKIEKPKTTDIPGEPPKTKLIQDGTIDVTRRAKKPPIDVMKRIIMKTLSECHYFKKLEEDSPLAFSSLREKLRYFHPAFHSMTPEGLNARLTFLQQCIRPGDTIPLKGIADDTDLNARNTSFGPPPICVLRIGDFYHSKIIIRDVNITFDDGVWDLNPEGIGVQPMIANVSLQVNFIGGQGLEKPVERLQNALSSNFYANTEMYDERSITTNSKMGGMDTSGFTKTFLEELLNRYVPPEEANDQNRNKLTKEKYLGDLSNEILDYTAIVDSLFKKTQSYVESFGVTYIQAEKNFGPIMASLGIHPNYRKITGYTVNTDSTDETISLFGLYEKTKDLSYYTRILKEKILEKIDSTQMYGIFVAPEFNFLGNDDIRFIGTEERLTEFTKTKVVEKIDEFMDSKIFTELEDKMQELINELDKLNFITKNGFDIKLEDVLGIKSGLSGFTPTNFYTNYKSCVTYIKENSSKFYERLDTTTIDFNEINLQDDNFGELLSELFSGELKNIMALFDDDPEMFDSRFLNQLEEAIDIFLDYKVVVTEDLITKETASFKFTKFLPRTNGKKISYKMILPETNETVTIDIKELFSSKVEVKDKLNYYKR